MLCDNIALWLGVSNILCLLCLLKSDKNGTVLVIEVNHKPDSVKMPSWVIAVCLTISVPLLFIGGPDYYADRMIKLLWDLGHILFMFFTGLLLVGLLSRLSLIAYWRFFGIYLFIVVMIAVATEYIQGKIGRVPSISDIFLDLWGALLAWGYIGWYPLERTIVWRGVFTSLILGFGILVLIKPIVILYDEVLAKTQFPLISGVENASELSRWSSKNDLVRSPGRATEGQFSLKVLLLPNGYSGVSIGDFPADWQGFDVLQFDVWSPLLSLPITVRVHDKLHVEGEQQYGDRFNRRYQLEKGWNRITIDLNDLLHSPKGRRFKLSEVEGIGLFSYNLGTTEAIYLDQVILLRKKS